MVKWMPVASPKHIVELSASAQLLNDREDLFVLVNTETSASAEVVLNVNNDECGLGHLI